MHLKTSPITFNNHSAQFTSERADQQALTTRAGSHGAVRGLVIAALVSTPIWILLFNLLHKAAASFR